MSTGRDTAPREPVPGEPAPERPDQVTKPGARDRPLQGRCVLLVREDDEGPLPEILREAGAEVRHLPVTRTVPPLDPEPLREAAAHLKDFDWIAVTSVRAVAALVGAVTGTSLETPGPRWACVGPATASALRQHLGRDPDLVPEELNAASLAASLLREAPRTSRRLLFPAAENARRELPDHLRVAGWEVTQVVAYRSVPRPPESTEWEPPAGCETWDATVLTSGMGVRLFHGALERNLGAGGARQWLRNAHPAVLGRTAEAALAELGVVPFVRSPRPVAEDLARAIVRALSPRRSDSRQD